MHIAALQMVSSTDLSDNLRTARRLLAQAAHLGAELAVLPEYFCLMGQRDRDKLALAETPGQGPIQAMLAQAARELGLWVVGGTLPMATADPERVANTSLVFNPQGECVCRYDKIHLFRFDNGHERCDETTVLRAGHTPTSFTLTPRSGPALTVGLSVCYDLRFPELYRRLQADLLLVPAAFTHTTGQATGRCCCAPAPLKTRPTCWQRPRAANTPTAGAPGATAWWWTLGARCWPSAPTARAWCWPRWTPPCWHKPAPTCPRCSTGCSEWQGLRRGKRFAATIAN